VKTPANILSRIRGEHVSAASATLPDVYSATEDIVQNVVDVPGIGKVLFTYRRHKYRHHKSTSWFWTAQTALLVDDLS
jgi:hypothetical protein